MPHIHQTLSSLESLKMMNDLEKSGDAFESVIEFLTLRKLSVKHGIVGSVYL